MAKKKTTPTPPPDTEAPDPGTETATNIDVGTAPEPAEAEAVQRLEIPIPDGSEVHNVSFKGAEIKVLVGFQGPNGPDTIEVGSTRVPAISFVQAKAALVPILLKLIEIPPRSANQVELQAVTFKRSSENARGAILKGFRKYAESAGGHAVNSPSKYTGDTDPRRVMAAEDWAKVETLADEALAFARGHGDNLDLFAPSSGDGAAGKPAAPADDPTADEYDDGGAGLAKIKAAQGA